MSSMMREGKMDVGDAVRPIRAGIEPEFDGEREAISYVVEHVRRFARDCGEPTSIAFVVTSKDRAFAQSWTMTGAASRGEACGYAAALLLKRAVE